jgi:hypothetical protein
MPFAPLQAPTWWKGFDPIQVPGYPDPTGGGMALSQNQGAQAAGGALSQSLTNALDKIKYTGENNFGTVAEQYPYLFDNGQEVADFAQSMKIGFDPASLSALASQFPNLFANAAEAGTYLSSLGVGSALNPANGFTPSTLFANPGEMQGFINGLGSGASAGATYVPPAAEAAGSSGWGGALSQAAPWIGGALGVLTGDGTGEKLWGGATGALAGAGPAGLAASAFLTLGRLGIGALRGGSDDWDNTRLGIQKVNAVLPEFWKALGRDPNSIDGRYGSSDADRQFVSGWTDWLRESADSRSAPFQTFGPDDGTEILQSLQQYAATLGPDGVPQQGQGDESYAPGLQLEKMFGVNPFEDPGFGSTPTAGLTGRVGQTIARNRQRYLNNYDKAVAALSGGNSEWDSWWQGFQAEHPDATLGTPYALPWRKG